MYVQNMLEFSNEKGNKIDIKSLFYLHSTLNVNHQFVVVFAFYP